MRTIEVTPAGILATIAVFAVVAACVRLGFWQLDRRAQKLERNETVAERMKGDAVPLTAPPMDTAELRYRGASAAGRYDTDRSLVLAGRSFQGAPGVHLYSPLLLGDGAILVNRGWLPARDAATVDLDPLRVDTPVTVTGVLVPFPDVEIDPATRPDGFRTTWFRLDGVGIRGQFPYPVAMLYLRAVGDEDATAGPGGAPRPVGAPTLDAGPHLSYAIQWFSFATIFLVGWAVMVLLGGGRRAGDGTAQR